MPVCSKTHTHKAKVEASSSSFSSADVLFCKANQDTLRDKQERLDPPFNSSDTFTIGIEIKPYYQRWCCGGAANHRKGSKDACAMLKLYILRT